MSNLLQTISISTFFSFLLSKLEKLYELSYDHKTKRKPRFLFVRKMIILSLQSVTHDESHKKCLILERKRTFSKKI